MGFQNQPLFLLFADHSETITMGQVIYRLYNVGNNSMEL